MDAPKLRRISQYGWIPDLPDIRDHLFGAAPAIVANLPARVDLRDKCPKVYDQGRIGSCTANAISAAFEYCLLQQRMEDFLPSRLFIYYNERQIERHIPIDSGAQIRDGIKSVAKIGVCDEAEWPYDDTPADPNTSLFPPGAHASTRPTEKCYQSARDNIVTSYRRLPRSLNQYKGCLASGHPFVFGFSVYSSFESVEVRNAGVLQMPQTDESMIGGHAVLAVGYDDATSRFIVRNSWGDQWGTQGYFTMPYAYLTDRGLASDFWTINIVT
jgi:C1A family cysteine protease